MQQFEVTGMHCAACSARVEKAVGGLSGVTSCSVSLLTNSMGVEGVATPEEIIRAVESAGYGATVKGKSTGGNEGGRSADASSLEDKETPVLKKRLIASLGFLVVLMYISMGHGMWGWPVPEALHHNPMALALLQLLLTAIVMVINQKFFVNGFRGLLRKAPNMDTLVALGSGAAFVYSTCVVFLMSDALVHGNGEQAMHYLHELYFESAAMILTLITVGKMLEARAKGKTTNALKALLNLAPKMATVVRDGKELSVPVEQVAKGDAFLVRPGEQIPVDGRVIDGLGAVDEAALTGESIPVDKEPGDLVSAGTMNQAGFLTCEATRVGEDTTLSQIIRMVSDAAATKAPIAKVADRVSGVFVPVVISIALVTTILWLVTGAGIGYALARGISVLVISCPCALGLATPVAIMVGNGVGAKRGIMFKTAASLEHTGRIQIVALDKTGTITKGEPKVTDVVAATGVKQEHLLACATALESKSEHPLAKAILAYGVKTDLVVSDFSALPGNGLSGKLDGKLLTGGSLRYMESRIAVEDAMKQQAEAFAEEGKTPLLFALDRQLLGIIAVADVLKEDSAQAIAQLKDMGIHVVMLTGDNERTAKTIGEQAGVDQVIAGVLPEGKADTIEALKKMGKVAMVGDGINDAPALTCADMGIAIGAGTDIAIDAAEVVLMKSSLLDVPAAIRLSKATLRNIHQNLFWAFFYNVIGIPLAAGIWIPIFGWELNPMFGAAAMSLSSFFVVSNALRLNLVNIHDPSKDSKWRQRNKTALSVEAVAVQDEKEDIIMKKTMKIEGMMCMHCEARVKKALEALEQVEEAVVSHEAGTAVLTLNGEIANEDLKKLIEDDGYQVLEILEEA